MRKFMASFSLGTAMSEHLVPDVRVSVELYRETDEKLVEEITRYATDIRDGISDRLKKVSSSPKKSAKVAKKKSTAKTTKKDPFA